MQPYFSVFIRQASEGKEVRSGRRLRGALACVASVSVGVLGAKNEERESKTTRKMAQVKERGGGGEKGRHMSILFKYSSQSGAAFAGERRFLKSRGLSASVSFLPLSLPPLSFFGSRFISRAAKTGTSPVPRSFFAPKLNGNACYAG